MEIFMKIIEVICTVIAVIAVVGGAAWIIIDHVLRSKKAKANKIDSQAGTDMPSAPKTTTVSSSTNTQPSVSEQLPAEKSMLSTATGVMILGIIGYVITALILISSFEDSDAKVAVIFSFIFGALVFVPLIMLPYHCAKVWAETSKNARATAEDLRALKAAIESQNAPTASASEPAQAENALECAAPLDKEKNS